MKSKDSRPGVELADKHARVSFFIDGCRPNGDSSFGEIDHSDILDGSFGFNRYESGEWGAGEFSIQRESIHSIVRQLRAFIHSEMPEVHIEEELRIDIVRDKENFILKFSMSDQLAGDCITVEKILSCQDLFESLLKPLYTISETYP